MAVEPTDIEYALSLLKARQDRDRLYSSYYGGSFDLSFVPPEASPELARIIRKLRCNRMRPVVDALADRTTITGWETSATGGDAIVQHAQDVWTRNRMLNRQNEIFKEAYRQGDGYAIVWPDDRPGPNLGNAIIYPNRAHIVITIYDDEYPDRIQFAIKCWRVDRGMFKGRWRLTTYDETQIVRYISISKSLDYPTKASQFDLFNEDGAAEVENPYGVVPIVHFGNDADTGGYGTSELADVVGLQDGLNNSLASQIFAEAFVSYPQKWLTGYTPESDPITGERKSPFQLGLDRLLVIQDIEAKFGQFDPAEMTQFLSVTDSWTLMIATTSRTPRHWFEGQGAATSGEQLKVSEAPFVSKVEDRTLSFTDPAAQVVKIALIIEGESPEAVDGLKPTWMPAESRSEQEKWNTSVLQDAAGIPWEQRMIELGYSPEMIAKMQVMREGEMAMVGATTPFESTATEDVPA